MSIYHLSLLLTAIVVGVVSYKVPRALFYIGLLAGSFIVSVAYLYWAPKGYIGTGLDTWMPPASLVAGVCDMLVCLGIWVVAKRRWEMVLYALMLVSVSTNGLYASGELLGYPPIPSRDIYALILEVINYLALALIGGVGILNRIEAADADKRHVPRSVLGGMARTRDALQKEAYPSKTLRETNE